MHRMTREKRGQRTGLHNDIVSYPYHPRPRQKMQFSIAGENGLHQGLGSTTSAVHRSQFKKEVYFKGWKQTSDDMTALISLPEKTRSYLPPKTNCERNLTTGGSSYWPIEKIVSLARNVSSHQERRAFEYKQEFSGTTCNAYPDLREGNEGEGRWKTSADDTDSQNYSHENISFPGLDEAMNKDRYSSADNIPFCSLKGWKWHEDSISRNTQDCMSQDVLSSFPTETCGDDSDTSDVTASTSNGNNGIGNFQQKYSLSQTRESMGKKCSDNWLGWQSRGHGGQISQAYDKNAEDNSAFWLKWTIAVREGKLPLKATKGGGINVKVPSDRLKQAKAERDCRLSMDATVDRGVGMKVTNDSLQQVGAVGNSRLHPDVPPDESNSAKIPSDSLKFCGASRNDRPSAGCCGIATSIWSKRLGTQDDARPSQEFPVVKDSSGKIPSNQSKSLGSSKNARPSDLSMGKKASLSNDHGSKSTMGVSNSDLKPIKRIRKRRRRAGFHGLRDLSLSGVKYNREQNIRLLEMYNTNLTTKNYAMRHSKTDMNPPAEALGCPQSGFYPGFGD